jgi:hypothetical protein
MRSFTLFLLIVLLGCSNRKPLDLKAGFHAPPEYTKPWVYWYWIDEQISKTGITRDLEAMKRVGIGQALIGHVSPSNKRGDVPIFSDAWWEMLEHAVREGGRLGVDIGFFNGPGWSQSGGPWIEPNQAMQYVGLQEVLVSGPMSFEYDFPKQELFVNNIGIIAFRKPEGGIVPPEAIRRIKTLYHVSSDAQNLFDQELNTEFLLKEMVEEDTLMIEVELARAMALQAVTFHPVESPFNLRILVEGSLDGSAYFPLRQIDLDRSRTDLNIGPMRFAPYTVAFPQRKCRKVRIILTGPSSNGNAGFKEIELTEAAIIGQYVEKQLGKMLPHPLPEWDDYLWPTAPEPTSSSFVVHPDAIRDLSENVDSAGTLKWEVPSGEWIIQRFSALGTGMQNAPLPPEASGLECDKLSKAAAQVHFDSFIGKFLDRLPPADRTALTRVVIDSYEVGPQNWTPSMDQFFMDRFGYDPKPWLPVLSGRVVGSRDQSNRFLWDLRRLSADLIAEHYMEEMRRKSNDAGLKLWVENYGHWGFPAEFLQYGGAADEISGEFWYANPYWNLGRLELRGASSATHIYGKAFTSAEAFTAGFNFRQYPGAMKTRGDWAFCNGINHFVMHLYIHQPWEDRIPGMNAWFGMSFQRHNTWFEQSRSWIAYLRRCHYLLRQGRHVADVCYFIGEDTPKMTGIMDPSLPEGYDFDFINAQVIEERLRVEEGWLTLPDGMRYRLLVLPPQNTMRPALIRKIGELVGSGASVFGPRPTRSPSLSAYPECDRAVDSISSNIWGACDGKHATVNAYGKGKIYYGTPLASVLIDLDAPPDVVCDDPEVLWIHRKAEETEIYFFSNQSAASKHVELSFRITGKVPELWDPLLGKIEENAYFEIREDRTWFSLEMKPAGSIFVIFRDRKIGQHVKEVVVESAGNLGTQPKVVFSGKNKLKLVARHDGVYKLRFKDGRERLIEQVQMASPAQINQNWNVAFPEAWGAPGSIIFDSLFSLTRHPHPDIRHFSGTARYNNAFELPDAFFSERYQDNP